MLRPSFIAAGLIATATLLVPTGAARAWSNHTLVTWPALSVDPAVVAAPLVTVETLEAFLADNESGVGSLLAMEQRWAEENVPTWPALPKELAFDAPEAPGARGKRSLRDRFVAAIRVNPEARQGLYLQVLPGTTPDPRRPPLAEATLLPKDIHTPVPRVFEAIAPGESVSPIAVVATASDEPDYGLDFGLFEDSGTDYGARAGLGKQSIGNPRLSYGTQAPFHMGFYHESSAVYAAAGFLRRMYPEERIHLYMALSGYAFRTGHAYWGWRFLGWALHYIEDLTQPYHATMLPGKSAAGAIWNNLLSMVGISGPRSAMITLASNRHLIVEDFELREVAGALLAGDATNPVLAALRDVSTDATLPAFHPRFPRDVIARASHDRATSLNASLLAVYPARYVDDSDYTWSVTEPAVDMLALLKDAPEKRKALETEVVASMRAAGLHVRKAVHAVSWLNQ